MTAVIEGGVSCVECLRDELMVGTHAGPVQRVRWDGSLHTDYCLDLARVPFCHDQLVMQVRAGAGAGCNLKYKSCD